MASGYWRLISRYCLRMGVMSSVWAMGEILSPEQARPPVRHEIAVSAAIIMTITGQILHPPDMETPVRAAPLRAGESTRLGCAIPLPVFTNGSGGGGVIIDVLAVVLDVRRVVGIPA